MPLYSTHIHYFAEVLPRLLCRGIFKVAVALVFTAVPQIFTRGGREVGARGKDEVLPQPDGSILSGGTVVPTQFSFNMPTLYDFVRISRVIIASADTTTVMWHYF